MMMGMTNESHLTALKLIIRGIYPKLWQVALTKTNGIGTQLAVCSMTIKQVVDEQRHRSWAHQNANEILMRTTGDKVISGPD